MGNWYTTSPCCVLLILSSHGYLFLLGERPQHTSHHRNLNSDLSITDDRGERLSHRRSSNLPLLLRARRGGLREMFQCIFATAERLTALLTENSGASHGQKPRSTGQPRRA